ncbi:MAG: aminotransferase class I/II-fold pyridoxal phosphate-dependent enzyme [Ramlibacter sp.]|nr:aminotransferase class I/II-fold pyridoxal phosphate-dependent enzyme [Ramlibacter sp.]
MEFIDLKTQYATLRTAINERIQGVLDHGQYIMGPEVAELEQRLSEHTGAKHCITVASGTDALLIALMAIGLKPGDEVITTPFSFAATAEVIVLLGGCPVFVDIEAGTCNMNARQIEAAITPRTRAIMPVSLYGQPADMDAINAIALQHGGLPVIEDAAQSFGSTYKGRQSCNLSTLGCTSFFPSKPLGCYGDGGAIFTNDDALATACREIRIHGQSARYHHTRVGIGGRMDTLQCAIILAKLERFQWEIEQRKRLADGYNRLLSISCGEMLGLPDIRPDRDCAWAQYTIRTTQRDEVVAALRAEGIPSAVHYPIPLHLQPAYAPFASGTFPVSEKAAREVMSLPMSADLTPGDQRRVVDTLARCLVPGEANQSASGPPPRNPQAGETLVSPDRLRVVIVVETFARDMGYINNTLPKYLARLGVDVHVITTELAPYFQLGSASQIFGDAFAASNRNEPGSRQAIDSYTLHTLKARKQYGYPRPEGLEDRLRELKPQIVCIFQAAGWIPLLCALQSRKTGFQLIIGSHMGKTAFPMAAATASVPPAQRLRSFLLRKMPGWFISWRSHHCVVPTLDCADVAVRFFGIPRSKIEIMNLPVDSDYFHPLRDLAERERVRGELGFAPEDLVCIYTGKLTAEKNAVVLLEAARILIARGLKVRALFVGEGEQASLLRGHPEAVVVPFMPVKALGAYYRAADIGVWMNESISFLDGASCGLPLVLSDTVKDSSHLREFASLYRTNDAASLADRIAELADPVERGRISTIAASLGMQRFGAEQYARRRLALFHSAMDNQPYFPKPSHHE